MWESQSKIEQACLAGVGFMRNKVQSTYAYESKNKLKREQHQ